MKKKIDSFADTTAWTKSDPALDLFYNQIPDFIAGMNDKSIAFKFPAGSNGRYFQILKPAFDITGYEQIVFHIWSRKKKLKGVDYSKASEFAYSLDFGTGETFLIPAYETFTDVMINVKGLSAIQYIKLSCLHDDADYLIMSEMLAVKDEFPVDIFRSVKEQFESDILALYDRVPSGVNGKGILVGSVSATVGDKSIIFNAPVKFLEKYSVILIDDGLSSERHQIDHNDGFEFFFNSNYDGSAIKFAHASKNVYIVIPIEFGLSEKEIILPCVNMWGMNPEEVQDIGKLDHVRDTFKASDNSVLERRSPAKFKYTIMIDAEARHNELIALMSLMIRTFLARQILWINGRKIEINPEGTSTFIDPVEGYNEIPKIQYLMAVEIKEEIFDRQILVKNSVNNIGFHIVGQGEI